MVPQPIRVRIVAAKSMLDFILATCFASGALRQVVTLFSMFRSARFLRSGVFTHSTVTPDSPSLIVAIPVLEEQAIIEETVQYFSRLIKSTQSRLVIITSQRELNNNDGTSQTTSEILQNLKECDDDFFHLHSTEVEGVKADQINYLVDMLPEIIPNLDYENTFIVIYDADSRPDPKSLECFIETISRHASVNLFQQSSLFRITKTQGQIGTFMKCAALRSNRYVFAYEIPKIIGRMRYASGARDLLSVISHLNYSHVTGHGLGIRFSFLQAERFPVRTIMEDMQYGFRMCCRRENVVPIQLLDSAETPGTILEFFRQSKRWFLGPARSFAYLMSPDVRISGYSLLMSVSAMLNACEWLFCALCPIITLLAMAAGAICVQFSAGTFTILYFATCFYTAKLCNEFGLRGTMQTIPLFPLFSMLFGFAGFAGLYLLCGNSQRIHGQSTKRAVSNDMSKVPPYNDKNSSPNSHEF